MSVAADADAPTLTVQDASGTEDTAIDLSVASSLTDVDGSETLSVEIAGIPATGSWTLILLAYAFAASVLPVTTLLQPRDFINSHQLIVALILLGAFAKSAQFPFHFWLPGAMAAPTPTPANPSSVIGVSTTRISPNSWSSPFDTLYAP